MLRQKNINIQSKSDILAQIINLRQGLKEV